MKFTFLFYLLLGLSVQAMAQTVTDSVTISGRITDYNNQPLDSVDVIFQRSNFSIVCQTKTDPNGTYRIRVPKGKYQNMMAVNMNRYIHTASPHFTDKEKRLEFWGFNYIADRDTTLNIQYDRMEAYGLTAWRIPGAAPSYMIYVRPMSLSRYQSGVNNAAPKMLLAAAPDQLGVKVLIDSEEVEVIMKQEIKEYIPGGYCNAYLLTVALPKGKTDLPYSIFKVQLHDLENGDKGEGIYFMEKQNHF